MQLEGWYQSSLPNSARKQPSIFTKNNKYKSNNSLLSVDSLFISPCFAAQRLPKADIYYASAAAIHVTFSWGSSQVKHPHWLWGSLWGQSSLQPSAVLHLMLPCVEWWDQSVLTFQALTQNIFHFKVIICSMWLIFMYYLSLVRC